MDEVTDQAATQPLGAQPLGAQPLGAQPLGAQPRGDQEQLQELWGLLLQEFLRYLQETPAEKLRSNKLEIIRAFLKDNNITIDGSHLFDVQQSLSKMAAFELPFH